MKRNEKEIEKGGSYPKKQLEEKIEIIENETYDEESRPISIKGSVRPKRQIR